MAKKPKHVRGWINLDDPCTFFPTDRFPKREDLQSRDFPYDISVFRLVDLVPVAVPTKKRKAK